MPVLPPLKCWPAELVLRSKDRCRTTAAVLRRWISKAHSCYHAMRTAPILQARPCRLEAQGSYK